MCTSIYKSHADQILYGHISEVIVMVIGIFLKTGVIVNKMKGYTCVHGIVQLIKWHFSIAEKLLSENDVHLNPFRNNVKIVRIVTCTNYTSSLLPIFWVYRKQNCTRNR